jgi:hypothetical protein
MHRDHGCPTQRFRQEQTREEQWARKLPARAPPSDGPSWSDLNLGLKVGPLVHTISTEMLRDFCAAMALQAEVHNQLGELVAAGTVSVVE